MQLVSAEPIVATAPTRPSLSRLCMSPVDQMTPVAQRRLPFRVGPNPGSLPVLATVHTIVNSHKGQTGHDRPRLQQTRIGIFNKPQPWLQPCNQVQTPLNQSIRHFEVPRSFSGRSCSRILGAVRRRPHDLKVARLVRAILRHEVTHMRSAKRESQSTSTHSQPASIKGLDTLPVPEQRFNRRISNTNETSIHARSPRRFT